MQTPKIRTYAANGSRIRDYHIDAVRHLESLSLVVLKRNRRGEILAALFRPLDGSNPLRATCNMGQKYSYLEPVGDGHRAWAHKPLLHSQDIEQLTGVPMDSPEDLDLYLRAIFRGVALSVMARPEDPDPGPKPDKVVSIDRKRSKRQRPVEFDSESRAA